MQRKNLTLSILITICLIFGSAVFAADPPVSCSEIMLGDGTAEACRDYDGDGWTVAEATVDCGSIPGSAGGQLNDDRYCDQVDVIGTCLVDGGTADETKIYYYNGEVSSLRNVCENAMGGAWTSIETQNAIMEEAALALVSDANVTVSPDRCDEYQLEALIKNNQAIEFTPVEGNRTNGLVIYPGGNVDPRAYAVAARMIAENGFFVAIVPFPGRLAITDPMRANHVLLDHPEISAWALAGHSLGGVAGSTYASANPSGRLKAMAWWASYIPEGVDLSQSKLKGLSIYATLDGIANVDAWNAALVRLPGASYVVDINGGNHAQFGYYGDQEGDNRATISREYQHKLFAGATIHLLNRINVPDDQDAINPLYTNMAPKTENIVQTAQKMISGLRFKDLGKEDINYEIIVDQQDFKFSKPSFATDGQSLVNITAYVHQMANPTDISLPPIYDGEIWIKMKSQQAFVDQYGVTPKTADQCGCDKINRKIFWYALGNTDWPTFKNFSESRVKLDYIADFQAATEPEWLGQALVLQEADQTSKDKRYTLKAARLEVPTAAAEPYGGNFYCKTWSPMAAMTFIIHNANKYK